MISTFVKTAVRSAVSHNRLLLLTQKANFCIISETHKRNRQSVRYYSKNIDRGTTGPTDGKLFYRTNHLSTFSCNYLYVQRCCRGILRRRFGEGLGVLGSRICNPGSRTGQPCHTKGERCFELGRNRQKRLYHGTCTFYFYVCMYMMVYGRFVY